MPNHSSFLEDMISSKKSPSVLRMTLLKVKKNHQLVFIFEGKDDYSYYEHAFKSCNFTKKYEHINGEGKEQLVNFLNELLEFDEDSKLIENTYFFIDQDYDPVCYFGKNIYNLPCYSIENMLLDESAIESILKSEFNLDAERSDLREHLITSFREAYNSFSKNMRYISYITFLRKLNSSGENFPKFSDLVEKIEHNNTIFKIDSESYFNEEYPKLINTPSAAYIDVLREMDDKSIIRGKYILSFIQEWCEGAKKHLNSAHNGRLKNSIRFGKEVVNIRRLSQSCLTNEHLRDFINTV